MGRRKAYKIFDLDYLKNPSLTEDDLYYIFETPTLNYSLVVAMFRYTNQPIKDEKKIIKLCKTDQDWMYKYFWSTEQRDGFEKELREVFRNIYRYGMEETRHKVEWWLFMYGLTNDTMKKTKKISKLCDD